MDTQAIVAAMQAEISRLTQAVNILTGGARVKPRGRPPKKSMAVSVNGSEPTPIKRTRTFTAAQRKKQAARMKAYWAAKKKQTAKKS